MRRLKEQGKVVRFLVVLSLLITFVATPSVGVSQTNFDEFIKSREVVTTLYFQPNAESLTAAERKRVSESIRTLRDLQNGGRMIRVEGFSSPEGDQEKNFILSFFRARSVADIIETQGLPAEVTLTGYGDLRAGSQDFNKERRVEIASYLKPVGMKRVKVANKKVKSRLTSVIRSTQTETIEREIDSYRLDQAIRNKIEDKKGIADKIKELEEELAPGLSQSKAFESIEEIERGYSMWRKSVDPDYSPKVSQVRASTDRQLRRGYSQSEKSATPGAPKLGKVKTTDSDLKRGYSQSVKAAEPGAPELGKVKTTDGNLQRGYSQSRKVAEPNAPKLGKVKATDNDLQRSFSRWVESVDPEKGQGVTILSPIKTAVDVDAPDVTMVLPDEMPRIDALMIEQAIMEKLGVEPTVPSGSVTQVAQPSLSQPIP